MDKLMGSKFGKRLDYNEWLKWWIKLTTSETNTEKQWDTKNNFDNEKLV